jgi:DNA-directed RNA polymerase subunit M/transcription elongation factor TFIIS
MTFVKRRKDNKMDDWNYYNWNASVRSVNFLQALKDKVDNEKETNEILQKIKFESKGDIDVMCNMMYEVCTRISLGEKISSILSSFDFGLTHNQFSEYIELEKKEINKILNPQEVKEGGFYTCPKCKSNKTMYFSRQVRRADEPPSTFIFCMNGTCKFTWRDG